MLFEETTPVYSLVYKSIYTSVHFPTLKRCELDMVVLNAQFLEQFALLFLVLMVLSFVVKLLKQPIIIGYVITGVIFAYFLKSSSLSAQMIGLSELGITFLLFLMGIEFDLKNLKYLGKDILVTTGIQSLLFFVAGFGLASLFGFSTLEKVYLAILFMFSSTLLVAKWIEDKHENTTLHGKIVLGTLITQDVIAIVAMTLLSLINETSYVKILLAPLKGIVLVILAFILARYLLNKPLRYASKNPELLFIFSLSVCFLFVGIAPVLGYSTTIGAFIAGVVLANTIYKTEILGRLKPLIIFFNMLFFVGLGFQMDFGLQQKVLLFIALLAALSVFLKPIIVYLTLRLRGYDYKTSFLSGLYLSQLSEFGVIIITGGVLSSMLDSSFSAIAIIAIIVTMLLSSYLIKYAPELYGYVEVYLHKYDRIQLAKREFTAVPQEGYNVLFFGYFDLNKGIMAKLKESGKKILVIESDPEKIELLKGEQVPYVYNSINNPVFFEHIPFEEVELVVSNLTDIEENKMIIQELKLKNPKSFAIVTAKNLKDSLELYNHQADYVIYSSYLNEQHVSILLEDYATDINKVISKRMAEISTLKEQEARLQSVHNKFSFMDIDTFVHTRIKDKLYRREKKIITMVHPKNLWKIFNLEDLFKEHGKRKKKTILKSETVLKTETPVVAKTENPVVSTVENKVVAEVVVLEQKAAAVLGVEKSGG